MSPFLSLSLSLSLSFILFEICGSSLLPSSNIISPFFLLLLLLFSPPSNPINVRGENDDRWNGEVFSSREW